MIRPITLALAGLLAALSLTGCSHGPAPDLASYTVTGSGDRAECMQQTFRAIDGHWACNRWRVTKADGTTYTKGYAR